MKVDQELVVLRHPHSPVAESFRALRATLSRSLSAGKRSFSVVSSWADEGKSMVSANMAAQIDPDENGNRLKYGGYGYNYGGAENPAAGPIARLPILVTSGFPPG